MTMILLGTEQFSRKEKKRLHGRLRDLVGFFLD